ncbi:MAG: cation:proton antiporter [Sulfurovum sp.]
MEHGLILFIITISIATLLNVFLKRYEIPTVIGYILSGLVIASIFEFDKNTKEMLSHLAEFGIVFLMFTIGLEFSVNHLKSMKKEVFVYGGLQVMSLGLIFTLLAIYAFGLETKQAIIIGFALSLSSTAIVLKVLNENNEIHSNYGRISLGILLFQDLAVIPILLMISFFTTDNDSIGILLLETLLSAVVMFFIIFLAGKYFVERSFNCIAQTNSGEIFLGAVILGVVSASVLAEELGFTYSLGAFLAGMTIAETKYRYRIEADLIPFRDILLGVFFVTIGMQIDWHSFLNYGDIIIFLLISIVSIKALILLGILKFFVTGRSAIKSALTLFQVGEFALVVFTIATAQGLIDDKLNQILTISVVISMILTPFMLKNVKAIADKLFIEPDLLSDIGVRGSRYNDHIIICGYGSVGRKLARKLREKQILYVILEHDVKVVDRAILNGEESIFIANAGRKIVLEHFDIDKSIAIIVTIENAIQMQLICENIVSFGTGIHSIVKVANATEAEIMSKIGMNHVLNGKELIAENLTIEALSCRI